MVIERRRGVAARILVAAMPTITDNAICIRRWDFSESSQTVSLFARDHGVLRGIVKGAKREKGRFSGGLDLLTLGQVVAIVKPTSELATLTEWTLLRTFRAVRMSLSANRAGLYMADLVHHMLRDHDPHPPLFSAFELALGALDNESAIGLTLLTFQWTLLDESGYRPELALDAATGKALPGGDKTLAFSAAAGGVVADTGTGERWRVRPETISLLRRISGSGAPDDESVALDTVDRANRLLAAYFREILGHEPNAMRWAFTDLGRPTTGGT